MTRADVVIGMTVYRTIFDHWGPGEVVSFRTRDNLGYRTARSVLVRWPKNRVKEAWSRLSELRRTPK